MLLAQAAPQHNVMAPSWFSVLALLGLLVVIALVAVVVVVLSTRRPPRPFPTPGSATDLADEVARLRQRVEALQRDVDELRRRLPGSGTDDRITSRGLS